MVNPTQLAETSSPVEVRFGTTQDQRRLTVAFRLILVIPQFVVLAFVAVGAFFVIILGWFAALFTGRLPASFARFLLGYVRWYTRVQAYTFLLTDRYPPFSLDSDPIYPVDVIVTTGRLNRAAVFFRIILVIPANIVGTVLEYGMFTFGIVTWVITLVLGRMPDSLFGATAATIRYQTRLSGYFLMLTSFYPGGVLGDFGPGGQRLEGPASGTPEAQPPPPVAAPAWGAGPTPAWGAGPGEYPPVPPPGGAYPAAPLYPPPIGPGGLPPLAPPPTPPPPPGYYGPTPPPPPGYYGPTPPPPPGYYGPIGPATAPPMQRWPLVLTKAARTMTVVFIVVGAVAYLTYTVALRPKFDLGGIETTIARDEVVSSYSTYSEQSRTLATTIRACSASAVPGPGELHCLEQADRSWAQALQSYSSDLSGSPYPASAVGPAQAAEAAATRAATILDYAADAPDLSSYEAAVTDPDFAMALDNVDSTYQQLYRALGGD
ncbi:MAG: DUF4389 domain-containing protein [Acidimicrobiales bacterium]